MKYTLLAIYVIGRWLTSCATLAALYFMAKDGLIGFWGCAALFFVFFYLSAFTLGKDKSNSAENKEG